MRGNKGLRVGAALCACAAIVAACVGDGETNVIPNADGGGDETSTGSGNDGGGTTTTDSGGSADTGAGGDAGCGAMTMCMTGCADLTQSPANCGACGHSCLGGMCKASACLPAQLTPSRIISSFALDAKNLYFASDDLVLSCPIAGCAGKQPTQIGVFTPKTVAHIAVADDFIFIDSPDPKAGTSHAQIWVCPVAGCPATLSPSVGFTQSTSHPLLLAAHNPAGGTDAFWLNPTHSVSQATATAGVFGAEVNITNDTSDGLAVDGTNVYFADTSVDAGDPTNGELVKCARGVDSCVRAGVGPSKKSTSSFDPYKVVLWKGVAYTTGPGSSGGSGIWACPLTGCAGGQAQFVTSFDYFPDIAVDDSGVYWIDEPTNVANPYTIKTCPLAGCSAGPKTIVTEPVGTSITLLQTDANGIYWVEESTPDGGTTGDVLLRLAK